MPDLWQRPRCFRPSLLVAAQVRHQLHLLAGVLGAGVDYVVELAEELEADHAEQMHPAGQPEDQQVFLRSGRDGAGGAFQIGAGRRW